MALSDDGCVEGVAGEGDAEVVDAASVVAGGEGQFEARVVEGGVDFCD